MKIDKDDILRGLPPQARPVRGPRQEAEGEASRIRGDGGDRIELSDRARALHAAKAALADLSEIREEKVAYFKQKIKDGTYQVPGEDVAQRLMDEGLFA